MDASVRCMFDAHQWALLPDDVIVQQYSECLLQGATVPTAHREKFPVIDVAIHVDSAAIAVAQELYQDREDFRYRVIPVMDMKGIAFSRQNDYSGPVSVDNFTVHVYPFNTLPVLVSHIHPKFVIMATAKTVFRQEQDAIQALIQQFPTLETILKLSLAWRNFIPRRAKEDRSYWPPYDPSSTDDEGNGDDDKDDKDCQDNVTEKGRLRLKRRTAEPPTRNRPKIRRAAKRPAQMANDGDNDIEDTRTEKGRYNPHRKRDRGKRHGSAVMAMVEHNRQAGTEGWSKEALINWSKQCDPEPARDTEILVA